MLLVKFISRKLIKKYFTGSSATAGAGLTRDQVDRLTADTLKTADILLRNSNIDRLQKRGNRLLVSAGLYHLALYRQLREKGWSESDAISVCYDIGWDMYRRSVRLNYWLFRPFIWGKQAQINAVVRFLARFFFSQDPEGYQRKIVKQKGFIQTDWTRCAVLQAIRMQGNDDDLVFMRNTWCRYDFYFPQLISKRGYYEREHTLSHGDEVCDMKWYATRPTSK